jgi:hypothetical protein
MYMSRVIPCLHRLEDCTWRQTFATQREGEQGSSKGGRKDRKIERRVRNKKEGREEGNQVVPVRHYAPCPEDEGVEAMFHALLTLALGVE